MACSEVFCAEWLASSRYWFRADAWMPERVCLYHHLAHLRPLRLFILGSVEATLELLLWPDAFVSFPPSLREESANGFLNGRGEIQIRENPKAASFSGLSSGPAFIAKTYTVPTRTPESKKPRLVTEAKCLNLLVPLGGIELPTFALRMRCSTN